MLTFMLSLNMLFSDKPNVLYWLTPVAISLYCFFSALAYILLLSGAQIIIE